MAIVLSAIIGSLVLALSGCSDQSGQTEKTLRVGVITYSQDDPFINALTDELKAHLKTMESEERRIIVSIKSGNDDQQEQNEKVEEMIDAGCDVLCVNLVDRTAPYRIIRMARNEKIPVIFFNREPVKEDLMQWDKLYYVGCDAEQSGIMQGEIAAEYINSHPEVDKNEDGKIQYVLLEGEAGHQDAISRTEYSVKTLMKNDVSLEKLSYQFADWNRGQAENRMNRLISQYGTEIELVLSNNDEMALGAVEAYRKVGYIRKDWPVIFGIDGLEDALEAVKAGEMQGSIYNDRVDQAKEMAKMAVTLFEGKDLDQESLKDGRYYFSEYKKVDGSNIEEYLNAEEEEADGKTWSHDFYRETDPAKRQQILKAHAGEEEAWAEEYRNRLWTARYGKYRLQKDEFVKCLMELKYLAEGSTLDLGGDRRRMGARILSALCLAEAMQSEECYQQILLEELYNVFLKFIQVSRGGRGFTSLVFGMGQLSEEGIAKKSPNRSAQLPFRRPACCAWKKNFRCCRKPPFWHIARSIRIGSIF